MINAANTNAAGGAASTMSRDKDFLFEAGAFAKELSSHFTNLTSRDDRVSASLSTLKSFFPNASFRVDNTQRDAESASKQFNTVNSDNEVVINADVLENMTSDTGLAEQVRQLLEGFLGGAWENNLLDSKQFEGQVWKSIDIQVSGVGYYESYQTPGGTSSAAITNLRMEFDYRMSQNLDTLLGVNRQNSGTSSASGGQASAGQSLFSGAWQFSAYFSSAAFQLFGVEGSGNLQNLTSNISGQSLEAIQIQVEMQLTMMQSSGMSGLMGIFGLVDPLVLDLGGEGINLRPVEDGVYFDMHGDGSASQTGFIQGNNALLYLDANGNGVADDINELFGDSEGYANGFEKLRQYDSNGDGVLDENDTMFANLRLWRDLNGDGVNQLEESMSLLDAGVKSINLNFETGWEDDGKGNVIAERSSFTRADGTTGTIADVLFKTLR